MKLRKESGRDFEPAPTGTHNAVCVDVVGPIKKTYEQDGKTVERDKLRVVWQIDEYNPHFDGPYVVMQWYTASLHENSNFCKMLESWRGSSLPEGEDFDTDSLIGAPCLVSVVHRESNGRIYANVAGVSRLPKGMTPMTPDGTYVRVKDRTNGKVADVRTATEPTSVGVLFVEDDDLPF